jgi:hypothetical protein
MTYREAAALEGILQGDEHGWGGHIPTTGQQSRSLALVGVHGNADRDLANDQNNQDHSVLHLRSQLTQNETSE